MRVRREIRVVDTVSAALAVGVKPSGFRTWARRRQLTPYAYERRGRRTVALYDLDAVYAASRRARQEPDARLLRACMSE